MFKSIPMSEDSVRRIRQRLKTETSRVIIPQPIYHPAHESKLPWEWKSKFYSEKEMLAKAKHDVGNLVWVREPLIRGEHPGGSQIISSDVARYAADKYFVVLPSPFSKKLSPSDPLSESGYVKWRWERDRLPSIFMPREASRSFLRINDRRIADLYDNESHNIVAEGFPDGSYDDFIATWNQLNQKRGYGWETENPAPIWIWRYSFRWEESFEFLFELVEEVKRRTHLSEDAVRTAIETIRAKFEDFDEKEALEYLLEMSKRYEEIAKPVRMVVK